VKEKNSHHILREKESWKKMSENSGGGTRIEVCNER
jgi:hypothetical protein